MKIVTFSDTHGCHESLSMPEGDMLIFAGDMCCYGQSNEVKSFVCWMKELPHKYKVVICGNHDWNFYKDREFGERVFKNTGIHYLQDRSIIIEEIKIYGSPWSPEFNHWAWMLPRGEKLKEKWDDIPEDTDILITHSPPATIKDNVNGLPVGCDDLLEAVTRIKPELHIFGHIHTSWGMVFKDGITFVNGSIVDDWNAKENYPIELEI